MCTSKYTDDNFSTNYTVYTELDITYNSQSSG